MSKKKQKNTNQKPLQEVIEKWSLPFYDQRHGHYIYLYDKARSNETRTEHIINSRHNLKVRDLEMVPAGINNYFAYKKDPIYKDTFNYYLVRKGLDRGFIKISVQLDGKDKSKGWIKTIYITYHLK